MAITRTPRRTTEARHWTDWVNVVAGIWLFVSPWALLTGVGTAGAWNAWILGVIIAVVALFSFGNQRTEWVNVAAAVWLFFSPWLLGFSQTALNMSWNSWVVSVIVFFVALAGATQSAGAYAHGHSHTHP